MTNHSTNSLEAFRKQTAQKKERDKDVILNVIAQSSPSSCAYIEIVTGIKHETVSARLRELMQDQKIKVECRRNNSSGNKVNYYSIRKHSAPLNVFKKTNKEKVKFLETILNPDQRMRLKRFENGEMKNNF